MKYSTILIVAITLVLGVFIGWFAGGNGSRFSSSSHQGAGTNAPSRGKIAYYQSSMHPWIKSDKPGNCTICGMKLVAVLEGGAGFETQMNLVVLSSNTITALNLRVEPVAVKTLKRTLRLSGILEDNESKHQILSAYVDGRIEELLVGFSGADVNVGELLATIYSPGLLAAEREYSTLVQSTNRLEMAPITESARIRLQRLGLTDKQIAELPKKPFSAGSSEILSPVTGTVVSKFVFAGQYVKEGDKIFELADLSTLWFNAVFYERDLPWLHTNALVSVTTPSVPGRTFQGQLTFINPTMDETTRSGRVRIEIENPMVPSAGGNRRLLLHRTSADAAIETRLENVLVIPRSAVLRPSDDAIVFVESGGNAYERRAVTLGRVGDDSFEILDGLVEGEKVVTQGNLLIDAQAQMGRSEPLPTHREHQNQ